MNDAASDSRTMIYKRTSTGDDIPVGYLEADGVIHRSRWEDGQPVGSVKAENRIFRNTAHGERELGRFTPEGNVHFLKAEQLAGSISTVS